MMLTGRRPRSLKRGKGGCESEVARKGLKKKLKSTKRQVARTGTGGIGGGKVTAVRAVELNPPKDRVQGKGYFSSPLNCRKCQGVTRGHGVSQQKGARTVGYGSQRQRMGGQINHGTGTRHMIKANNPNNGYQRRVPSARENGGKKVN